MCAVQGRCGVPAGDFREEPGKVTIPHHSEDIAPVIIKPEPFPKPGWFWESLPIKNYNTLILEQPVALVDFCATSDAKIPIIRAHG
jgi:hypothetical protein